MGLCCSWGGVADLYAGGGAVRGAMGMTPAQHPARTVGTEQAIDVWGLRKENGASAVYAVETPARPGTQVTTVQGARSSLKASRMPQAARSVHLLPVEEKAW